MPQVLLRLQSRYIGLQSSTRTIRANHRTRQLREPDFHWVVFPECEAIAGAFYHRPDDTGRAAERSGGWGLFEDHVAQSLVVVIYHLWNEYYRPRIAKAASSEPNQVECDLLGDIRRVRNLIIHETSILPCSFANSLTFLPQIWNFESTELRITRSMVHSLMEQLNALRLTITDPRTSAKCPTCGKSL